MMNIHGLTSLFPALDKLLGITYRKSDKIICRNGDKLITGSDTKFPFFSLRYIFIAARDGG